MWKRMLFTAGAAFTMLFFALNTVSVHANACDDEYWSCIDACDYNGCSLDCLCGYAACQNPQDPLPQGCQPPG